jgi:competence protein ComEA
MRSVSRSSTRLAFALAVLVGGSSAQLQLPEGPGREEAARLCKGCHELERSFSIRRDRVGWQETMSKMVTLGVKGTPEELNAILEYAVKNFPADEVPPLNVNKAKAIEFESRLSLPRSQAAAIIAYRSTHGPFKTIDDLKKVPGISIEKIEAKKDRLVFSLSR